MSYPWHEPVWRQVNKARLSGHLPHALLFSGQDGCGHEAFVLGLAQGLLCLQPADDGKACGHCRSCLVYASAAHPDYMLVTLPEDKQVIGIEQIRGVRHFLELSCSYSPSRVAVVLLAEAMNANAANGLLKSLEEPTGNTHILLFSLRPADLLPTIRSRCQHLRLPLPATVDAIHWLGQQNPVQPPETLLKLAAGKPLAALAQDSGEKLAQQGLFINHISALLKGESSLVEVSAHWEKYPRRELLDWQLEWLHAFLHQRYGTAESPALLADFRGPLAQIAGLFSNKAIWGIYDRLLELKQLSAHPLNARLFVENMLSLWLFARS